jgi:hypothetical protein
LNAIGRVKRNRVILPLLLSAKFARIVSTRCGYRRRDVFAAAKPADARIGFGNGESSFGFEQPGQVNFQTQVGIWTLHQMPPKSNRIKASHPSPTTPLTGKAVSDSGLCYLVGDTLPAQKVWQKTKKWKPAKPNTASGGGPVENSETGELAFAKAQSPQCEKIASDLANLVGLPVPRVVLDNVEGDTRIHAVSSLHGKESIDIPLLRERLPKHFESQQVQDALKQSSGMLALYAWLATTDLKDDHLMVATDEAGAYSVAAIDFVQSLAWPEADGGTVQPPAVPACLANNIDKNRVADAVARIEALNNDQIQAVINAIPDGLLNPEQKMRVASGLIGRRGRIREVMTQKGWMP